MKKIKFSLLKLFYKLLVVLHIYTKLKYNEKRQELRMRLGLVKDLGFDYTNVYDNFQRKLSNKPLVSVIVPNYNHAKFLKKRLDSIYGQSYKNIEVILLDDCSSDNSRDILTRYANKYSKNTQTIFNEKNAGSVFKQWGKGIANAKGDIIWIAESDDYCSLNFLQELVPFFVKDSSVMIACAYTKFMSDQGEFLNSEKYLADTDISTDHKWIDSATKIVKKGFAYKNIIPNASGCIFRNPKNNPILNNEEWLNCRICGDWLFYLEIARGGKIAFSNKAFDYFTFHGKSNTTTSSLKQEKFYKEHAMVIEYLIEHYDFDVAAIDKLESFLKETWVGKFKSFDENKFKELFDSQKLKNKYNEKQEQQNETNSNVLSDNNSSTINYSPLTKKNVMFVVNSEASITNDLLENIEQMKHQGKNVTIAILNLQKEENDIGLTKLTNTKEAKIDLLSTCPLVYFDTDVNHFAKDIRNLQIDEIICKSEDCAQFINKYSKVFARSVCISMV